MSSPSSPPASAAVYCLCTHKLRATSWNSQFARLIQEVNESSLRVSQLRQIDKFMRFDTFICRSKESELNAAQAMLSLWGKLLSFTQRWWAQHISASPSTLPSQNTSPAPAPLHLPSFHPSPAPMSLAAAASSAWPPGSAGSAPRMRELRLVFELIDHLVNRHEFDLIHLLPPSSPPSSLSSLSLRMYRVQSMTVPRGDPRGATEQRGERGSPSERLYGSGGRFSGGGDSNTVPSSPSSFHPRTGGGQPHPTFLSHAEQLHLLQSYRQLLQHTVAIVLRMVRESSEGRCEIALSSHSSTASFFSSTSASASSTASNSGETVGEGWEGGADAIREEDVNELNDAMMVDEHPNHHGHPALHEHISKTPTMDADGVLKGDCAVAALTLEEHHKEAEREAVIEKLKVEQMKPELTVDVHVSGALLSPLLPAQPLSPLSGSSPLSPLSPLASTVPSPTSSAQSFSSTAASSSSSLSNPCPSLLTRPDFVWFTGRLLAIVFFRLPVLSGTIIDSLSSDAIADRRDKADRECKPAMDGAWRETLRAQIDEWSRRQPAAAAVKKTPSISNLHALVSSASSNSLTGADDSSDLGFTRSMTLPASVSQPLTSSASASRAQRSLTSAFLHANPSFFEWTKPELNRDTHTTLRDADREDERDPVSHADDESERGAVDASAGSEPDSGDDDVLSTNNQRCIKLLLSHPAIFFTFASAWMSHVQHTTNPIHPPLPSPLPPFINAHKQELHQSSTSSLYADAHSDGGIMWDLIPGYRLLLHTVLKRLIMQPVQQEEDDDDDAEIDPTEAPALSPLIDADWLRRKEERKDERAIVALRKEASTECQTYILKNSDSRSMCLSWLTEVLLRHTAVTDKRGVEKTLESLDTWYVLFLSPEAAWKKLPISMESSFSAHSLPHSRLAHHLPAVLTPHVTLPWLSSTPATFLAQQRERCVRARLLMRHTVVNPSMSHPFPPSYCSALLLQALTILLHQEHFQVLLKTLTFIYMHTGHFYGEERAQLFTILLSRELFPRLFLHWCTEIRRVFHCILVYRLMRDGRMPSVIPGGMVERVQRTVTMVIEGKEEQIPVVDVMPASPSPLPAGTQSPATHASTSPSPSYLLSPPSHSADGALHPSPPSSPSRPPRKLSNPHSVERAEAVHPLCVDAVGGVVDAAGCVAAVAGGSVVCVRVVHVLPCSPCARVGVGRREGVDGDESIDVGPPDGRRPSHRPLAAQQRRRDGGRPARRRPGAGHLLPRAHPHGPRAAGRRRAHAGRTRQRPGRRTPAVPRAVAGAGRRLCQWLRAGAAVAAVRGCAAAVQ